MVKYHYSTVLSVTDGRLVADGEMKDVIKLLETLYGGPMECATQILMVGEWAQKILRARFPELAGVGVKTAITLALRDHKRRGKHSDFLQ